MIIEHYSNKEKLSLVQKRKLKKAQDRLAIGKNDPKYHTYRKKDVFEFCKKYADDILRPVFDWSGQEVIDYAIDRGIDPNPLYKMGMSRVGCFPCMMCNQEEIKTLLRVFPLRLKEIQAYEDETGRTFFKPDYIPTRYRTGESINKKGKKVKFSRAIDVEKYVTDKNATIDMFNSEPTSCMSFYGLCE